MVYGVKKSDSSTARLAGVQYYVLAPESGLGIAEGCYVVRSARNVVDARLGVGRSSLTVTSLGRCSRRARRVTLLHHGPRHFETHRLLRAPPALSPWRAARIHLLPGEYTRTPAAPKRLLTPSRRSNRH
jgi:hypothetical protein